MTRRKRTQPPLLTEMNRAIDLVTPRSVSAVATELIGPVPSWLPADIVDGVAQACENLLSEGLPNEYSLATVREWLPALTAVSSRAGAAPAAVSDGRRSHREGQLRHTPTALFEGRMVMDSTRYVARAPTFAPGA